MYLSSHGYIFIGCWATVNTLNFNYGLDHFAVSVENVLSCLFFPCVSCGKDTSFTDADPREPVNEEFKEAVWIARFCFIGALLTGCSKPYKFING